MVRILALFLPFILASAQSGSAADVPLSKPNLLLIISDDQGFGDFGFNGNKLVKTPNLDRLASQSAVYRNFVVAAACSPTRAALFTGRDHLLTGVWGVGERAALRDDETRMPAFFKAAGYRTLHVGKIDCAKAGKKNPTEFGWEDWLCGGGYEHRDPMMWKPQNSHRGQGWAADIWTDYALNFLRERRSEPWFASIAYIIPHLPWICDEKYSAPFVERGCSKNLAACYGSIAHLDACIGRLLDGLRETGQEQRTIVAFLSDNGPTSPEVKSKSDAELAADGDWVQRNVAGLRGHKANIWENGDRVPLLVRWPGRIEPGERRQFGAVEDVLPTLLGLAGIGGDSVAHLPFSGSSLQPSLADASVEIARPAVFRMAIAGPGSPRADAADAGGGMFGDYHLALRGPRFKFHSLPGGQAALYDVLNDPGEQRDVQDQFPEIAQDMGRKIRWRWDEIIGSGRAFGKADGVARKGKGDE